MATRRHPLLNTALFPWEDKISAMKKAIRFASLSIACLSVAFLAFPQSNDDSLDSLKVCAATQKLIFENEFVRVIDDQIPVGVAEPLHRHRHGVVISLTDSTYETVSQGGNKTVSQHKEGTALWSEATVHTVKNVGSTLAHAIRIEIKH
jgi:hypothetical protein